MYKRNAQGWTKHGDFVIIELISQQLAYLFACMYRMHQFPYSIPLYRTMALVLLLIDFIVIITFCPLHNVTKRGYWKEFTATIRHCTIVFGLASLFMFALKSGDEYSRLALFITYLLHILCSYGLRTVWKKFIEKHGPLTRAKDTMLVVLKPESADTMMQRLTSHPIEGYQIIGVVLNGDTDRTEVCGVPIVAKLEDAAQYISREWVDSVYIDSDSLDPKIIQLMNDCREMALPVHYHVPSMSGRGEKQFVEKIGGTTVLTTSINYATPLELLLKRGLDILGGLVGSLIALIIMAVVGPIIKKQSPGPILYKSMRIGQNGKQFKMYKIRSMYLDADERKKHLMAQNRIKDGMMFKLDFDPRIIGNEIQPDGTKKTGIGEFIRKTSLDEFPQFFNVLKGEMALVGTRPPTPDEFQKYAFHHRARLACKPGVTGMWQVSGRSEITDFEEVVHLDTEYITNWTLGMDIKILLKTVWVVLCHKGAL